MWLIIASTAGSSGVVPRSTWANCSPPWTAGSIAVAAGRVSALGQPHEVAEVVAYLVREDASFVHGAVLAVDGGGTAARWFLAGLPTVVDPEWDRSEGMPPESVCAGQHRHVWRGSTDTDLPTREPDGVTGQHWTDLTILKSYRQVYLSRDRRRQQEYR